jgi:hypothetical protein
MLTRINARALVTLLSGKKQKVTYGAFGAFLASPTGNLPEGDYGSAAGSVLRAEYGETDQAASFVVSSMTGLPSGAYGIPPNSNYDPDWSLQAPVLSTVSALREWIERVAPGWLRRNGL